MSAANELMSNYQHVVSKLELVTGSKGVFDVTINDQLIYSKHETNRFPNENELLSAMAEIVGPEVKRFGT